MSKEYKETKSYQALGKQYVKADKEIHMPLPILSSTMEVTARWDSGLNLEVDVVACERDAEDANSDTINRMVEVAIKKLEKFRVAAQRKLSDIEKVNNKIEEFAKKHDLDVDALYMELTDDNLRGEFNE
jgi:hypothetical protein